MKLGTDPADGKDVITAGIIVVWAGLGAAPEPQGGWQLPPRQQDQKPKSQPTPQQSPQAKAPTVRKRRVSDFEDRGGALPGDGRTRRVPAAPGGAAPRARGQRLDEADLREVFTGVGFPSDLRELGGVVAKMQLVVFDHRGGVLADLVLRHVADLAAGLPRDRLEFSGVPSVNRVYGRDGDSVFAEMYGMAWQPLEKQAAEELQVFGLLLRAPWGFDSGDGRFTVSRKERITVGGQDRVRIRIRRRAGGKGVSAELKSRTDQFDLICEPQSMLVKELHMIPAATGNRVVVKLEDYALFGEVSIPLRRVVLSPSGKRVMELRIKELKTRQKLPASLFQPRQ